LSCYEEHVLLTYLDGELKAEGMAVESHLRECEKCQARLKDLAERQQFVEGVLTEHLDEIELGPAFKEESWIRMKFRLASAKPHKPKRKPFAISRGQRRLAVAAVFLFMLGCLSLGSVRGAVADFLSVFRMEKIETISISPEEMEQINQALHRGIGEIDIKNLGTLKVEGPEETIWDGTLAEARKSLDFTVITPVLEGYGEPSARIKRYAPKSLTLNVPGINGLIQKLGGTVLLPAELNGQTVTLEMPPQLFLNYVKPGLPSVVLVQMKSPELKVPGSVRVELVRDALLSLPFWPEGIRQQLAGINDWRHTMVVPQTANSQPVVIRGCEGMAWSDPESSSASLLWSENGIIYSLAGELSLECLLEIAEGMQ